MTTSYDEVFVTSRSRTPSLIDVTSENEKVFAQLPDLIQEAAVSLEFSSPELQITRVQNPHDVDTDLMTEPMFFITPRRDSGIDMPDINVTDERLLGKYGSDLTANFADIRAFSSKAFFKKQNLSNGWTYSLCTCATGYIWVSVRPVYFAMDTEEFSDLEIQIGTFALKIRAITTREILCRYKYSHYDNPLDGQLAVLFSTILAKYLRLRIMGQQYEYAAETAIKLSRKELSALRVVDPARYQDFSQLLRKICANAPMPPTSDVSLISRSMITRRWECWREKSVLKKRYSLPQRIVRCLQRSPNDSIDLLSDCFKKLTTQKSRLPILSK